MIPYETGLNLRVDPQTLDFHYGPGVRGPKPEYRQLDAIRPSLMDPLCSGPEVVYSIAMDVFREEDESDLKARYLLFGVVAYAAGRLGKEPVRSQGHVHKVAPHHGYSTPELFEIWEGTAIIYAQEHTADDPGRCFAVTAGPGEKVVVPPGWAHAVINGDVTRPMIFGAWCDRQYGFDYTGIRSHGGLAYFPIVEADDSIRWIANTRYAGGSMQVRNSRSYPELGLDPHQPIYTQYRIHPEAVEWVAHPERFADTWSRFEP